MVLDINRMTKSELKALEGITEQIASAIIERRLAAPLTSLDQLTSLPGIGQKTVARLKEQGVSCLPRGEATEETFVCRSCGRTLPAFERETSNHVNQHICNACYSNLTLWTMTTGGA